eukprot:scaffold5238_cov177-Amphora_coffeaeformis.AAC.5
MLLLLEEEGQEVANMNTIKIATTTTTITRIPITTTPAVPILGGATLEGAAELPNLLITLNEATGNVRPCEIMDNFVPVEEVEAGVETFPFMVKPVAEVTMVPFGTQAHAGIVATTTCTTAMVTAMETDHHTQVNHPKIKATMEAVMACKASMHQNGLIDYPARTHIPMKHWEPPKVGIPMHFRRDGP